MTNKDKKQLNQSPKGMRDLIGAEYYSYQGFAERAAEIANYYGFKPIETPMLEEEGLFVRTLGETTDIVAKEIYTVKTKGGDRLALRPEATAPIMRAYLENGLQAESQPVMLYFCGPLFRHDKPQRGRYREFRQFDLEVIGTGKSVTDALVIKLMLTILEEVGLTGLKLSINSLGDRECRGDFKRDLSLYYKKHTKELCADCLERLKTNPLRLLDCKNPPCQALKERAPSAVGYLCQACKTHFKEVLETLETMGITYEIDNTLVRGLDYYSRTVFEIFEPGTPGEMPLALGGGGRYDYLARALGNKKDIPAVGGALGVDRVLQSPRYVIQNPRIIKKPKIFLIQLGPEAKMKSFEVIEVLRKARIPVAQSLSKDSLGVQLGIAERLQVPYTVILGQKEAIEGTVIFRHMINRSQDTIKISDLHIYLKQLPH